MTNIQAILFDLDGTLIDSEYYYYCCWSPILREKFDINIDYSVWLRDFAGHTDSGNFNVLREQYHVEIDDHSLKKEILKSYGDRDMTTIGLMPFATEILESLKSKKLRIGLVTSSPRDVVDLILGHHRLLDYFDLFVTRDVVKYPKPNPEPYLKAIDALQLPVESILAIEDTLTGYSSATAAGLDCYVVTDQEAQKQKLPSETKIVSSLEVMMNKMF